MPVDPSVVHESVQQLLAGVGRPGPVGTVRPLVAGLEALIVAALPILKVDRIGVLLLDEHGQLRMVASTDDDADAMEHLQADLGIGPGVDTVDLSVAVIVSDLFADERYPRLADTVAGLGVRAVVSAPVWVNGAVAGNLNAFRAEPHVWAEAETQAVQAYADVVATLLQFSAMHVRNSGPTSSPGADDQEAGLR
jgi:GAF domain-containing protein